MYKYELNEDNENKGIQFWERGPLNNENFKQENLQLEKLEKKIFSKS